MYLTVAVGSTTELTAFDLHQVNDTKCSNLAMLAPLRYALKPLTPTSDVHPGDVPSPDFPYPGI